MNKKFEFVLYINENIICQRFFSVKKYNPKIIKSLELVDCLNYVVSLIENDLKEKSMDYLYNQYNPYRIQKLEDILIEDIYKDEDVFDFEIKIDEKLVAKRRFTGNVYPQRVRYSVDIRRLINKIINEIQKTLSSENITVEYCGIRL